MMTENHFLNLNLNRSFGSEFVGVGAFFGGGPPITTCLIDEPTLDLYWRERETESQ